jgi:hypothetical protein
MKNRKNDKMIFFEEKALEKAGGLVYIIATPMYHCETVRRTDHRIRHENKPPKHIGSANIT